MQKKTTSKSITLDDGREITIETGKLARQAHGSVVLKMNNTMLLATAVAAEEAKENVNFLPLSVDYQEKFASAGKIPGSFLRREGRLSDSEVLTCRLVDRALRPMFPNDFHAETQINIFLISADHSAPPDALAALAASCAIAVSDIPFTEPISEVRVIKKDGQLIINPATELIEKAEIELVVAATEKSIVMVEGEMDEASEEEMIEAIAFAHNSIKAQCQFQKELSQELGIEKRTYQHEGNDEELEQLLTEKYYQGFYDIAKKGIKNKKERKEALDKIKESYLETIDEEEANLYLIEKYFHAIEKKATRDAVLNEKIRLDGRKTDEIRDIWSEIDYLPSAHGSSIFTRGETQALATVTLGTKLNDQLIDRAMETGYNKFFLHYNFPGFSTGEVRPNRGPGRRETGHGILAQRALKKVVNFNPEDNPYSIRIVSDILESNGSSSMATVCAGSLALMDAGIKIKRAVSGIAMGLIFDSETEKYTILSDILGDEDHLGDMDFKVAGTSKGITACQMDVKIEGGLKHEILVEALAQAKKGRSHILSKMDETISESKTECKPNVPQFSTFYIPKEMIGLVIGPGGKNIQALKESTETNIMIDDAPEGGFVQVFGNNKQSIELAEKKIKGMVTIPQKDDIYEGKVVAIQPYGAFVEFLPGKEGLLHISEIKWERVENMEGVLEIGEEITVKLIDIDDRTGKFKLSRKALLPKPEKK